MKTIPILIPHFRAEEKLKKCIAHIEAQNYHPVEIFVRDNSDDNILFTAAINEGLYKYAFRDDVDYVLVLNQDAYLGADTLISSFNACRPTRIAALRARSSSMTTIR